MGRRGVACPAGFSSFCDFFLLPKISKGQGPQGPTSRSVTVYLIHVIVSFRICYVEAVLLLCTLYNSQPNLSNRFDKFFKYRRTLELIHSQPNDICKLSSTRRFYWLQRLLAPFRNTNKLLGKPLGQATLYKMLFPVLFHFS